MSSVATSRGGVPIRLPAERWNHIVEEHGELAGMEAEVLLAIAQADCVLAGKSGELFALRMVQSNKALVVVYRERDASDGFVITAFLTTQVAKLLRRLQVWPAPT